MIAYQENESTSSVASIMDNNNHSFPTRRSSDLGLQVAEPQRHAGAVDACRGDRVHLHEAQGEADAGDDLHRAQVQLDDRSEENTSELQSRSDIVCRLLLE